MHPISEERTIRDLVLPALGRSDWGPSAITRELPITAGRRMVANGRIRKGERLYADLALLHQPGATATGHPISLVEVKRTVRDERTGVQQVKEYGRLLDLPLVYATNGRRIIEVDLAAGTQHEVDRFRSPQELWQNYRSVRQLNELGVRLFEAPYSRNVLAGSSVKEPRYYQHVAIQRLLAAIASGDRRLLTVLATGTGKSFLSAQLVHSLWAAHWPRGVAAPDPRPRVLYLADRDVLVNDPMVKEFRPIFGEEDAVRVRGGTTQTQARINFSSYQALDSGELFARYEPTWFDLVIIDECHRGSAAANSQWREILDHFAGAVHLGLTATPRADAEADTFEYFGKPTYQYSLKQGIEDGFLAPFEVARVLLSTDLDGVTIEQGTVDDEGVVVPAKTYKPRQLERKLVIPARTEEAAGWVSRHLANTHRMAKTIVFCVDQDHAARFAEAIGNLNPDLMVEFDSDWAVRITSDEGERGRVLLGRFQNAFEPVPVVVSSSDMLTTGVDASTVRNVVFLTPVRSMTKFKQMVGRGTRLAEEQGKEFFTIVDFTGVTGLFADASFDGLPVRNTTTSSEADEDPAGEPIEIIDEVDGSEEPEVAEPAGGFEIEAGGVIDAPGFPDPGDGCIVDDDGTEEEINDRGSKHVVRGIDVTVLGEYLYVVEPDSNFRLRAIRIESWAKQQILELGLDAGDLRRQWADAVSRRALVDALAAHLPFTMEELAQRLGFADADPLDVLLRLAYGMPLRTRSDRLAQFTRSQQAFLNGFAPEARRILEMILDKYAEHGPGDLDPRILAVPPLSDEGSVVEIASRFGGPDAMRAALDELSRRLYEAS